MKLLPLLFSVLVLLSLAATSKLLIWGLNTQKQTGSNDLDVSNAESPRAPKSDVYGNTTIVQFDVGSGFTLALGGDGSVYAWGRNDVGQLGDGTVENRPTPVVTNITLLTSAGKRVKQVAAGLQHGVALTEDSTIITWGFNGNGQLGDGTLEDKLSPVFANHSLIQGKTLVKISVNNLHSLALASDGTVFRWGDNAAGQIGDSVTITTPTSVLIPTPIPSSEFSSAIPFDIAAGNAHTIILARDGSSTILFAMGSNNCGQLGIGGYTDASFPTLVDMSNISYKEITKILAGDQHSMALSSDGSVFMWGKSPMINPPYSSIPVELVLPATTSSIIGIYAKVYTFFVVYADGSVVAWGANDSGQFDTSYISPIATPTALDLAPFGSKNITQIIASDSHSAALMSDGTMMAFGNAFDGQIGAGYDPWGYMPPLSVNFNTFGGKRLRKISFGRLHNIAYANDGKVYTWGAAYSGQIGVGVQNIGGLNTVGTPVSTLFEQKVIKDVAAKGDITFVLTDDGQLFGWGDGNGAVAPNPSGNQLTPIQVTNLPVIQKVFPMRKFTVALAENGAMLAWGDNTYGQLGIGNMDWVSDIASVNMSLIGSDTIVKVDGYEFFAIALGSSGRLYSWGDNLQGILGTGGGDFDGITIPSPITVSATHPIVDIACGAHHTLALDSSGAVHAWGQNDKGQLGTGDTTTRRTAVAIAPSGVMHGKKIAKIAAASETSYALSSEGLVYAWGKNNWYQVGDGTTTNRYLPVLATRVVIPANYKIVDLVAGGDHAGVVIRDYDVCNGRDADVNDVCSGHGNCVAEDTCACNQHYFGQDCQVSMCFGILSNDTRVCSGKGRCASYNNCQCNDLTVNTPYGYVLNSTYGPECELSRAKYYIASDITQDVALTDSPGAEYVLRNSITISQNSSLVIPSNTIISMLPNSQIMVQGSLVARGNADNWITFRNADASSWKNLVFTTSQDVSILEYVRFEGGGGNDARAVLEIRNAPPVVANQILFVNSTKSAVYACGLLPRVGNILGNTPRSRLIYTNVCN